MNTSLSPIDHVSLVARVRSTVPFDFDEYRTFSAWAYSTQTILRYAFQEHLRMLVQRAVISLLLRVAITQGDAPWAKKEIAGIAELDAVHWFTVLRTDIIEGFGNGSRLWNPDIVSLEICSMIPIAQRLNDPKLFATIAGHCTSEGYHGHFAEMQGSTGNP